MPSFAADNSKSEMGRSTQTFFRSCIRWECRITGRRRTRAKRVFLLTRSAFLGQQRVGATVWSGDVYGSYWGLSHQVPAGLNFALSGYPYWTTDIGGYWPAARGSAQLDPAFQELYARWFEFGAFCPIFRTSRSSP